MNKSDFKFAFFLLLFITGCSATFVIEKDSKCLDMEHAKFSTIQTEEIESFLKSNMKSPKYELSRNGENLELITRTNNIKDKTLIEKLENKADILFEEINLKSKSKSKDSKVIKVLRNFEMFKPYDKQENLYYSEIIVGYVENEVDLQSVNRELAKRNIYLSQEHLYWWSYGRQGKDRTLSKYYLLNTAESEEVKMGNIENYTKEIKAYYEPVNFEPAIKLFLNDCGLETYGEYFKEEDQKIFAVIIENQINSLQWVRVRKGNEISIFGYKTFEEAKAVVKKLQKKNLYFQIK